MITPAELLRIGIEARAVVQRTSVFIKEEFGKVAKSASEDKGLNFFMVIYISFFCF